MDNFVGSYISLDCGGMGIYQGQITYIDPETQKITLQKVFCNGLPCSSKDVTISAEDIQNLELINVDQPRETSSNYTVDIKKPIAKRASNTVNGITSFKGLNIRESPRKQQTEERHNNFESYRTPSKKDKLKQRMNDRDEAAFGQPMEKNMSDDFDFEKNLALFNKKAVFDEINASKPDVVRQTDKKSLMYRCDENVLMSKPTVLRRININDQNITEYVTDSGLVVPSVSIEKRKQILNMSERLGLTFERQSELIGRAATEIALLVLGGAHRINPNNLHQCPNVVILSGSHRAGSQAVNCARHLATHGIKTTVFIQDPLELSTEMTYELSLYRFTNNKVTTVLKDISTAPVDLIILALSDPYSSDTTVTSGAKWASENKAQILAMDPPPSGTNGVKANFSIVPALPLSHNTNNGKIYLCNLGIPQQVYLDVGVTYSSPFGPKFFVALHPNNE